MALLHSSQKMCASPTQGEGVIGMQRATSAAVSVQLLLITRRTPSTAFALQPGQQQLMAC